MSKVALFDRIRNEVIEKQQWSAKLKLKHNHIANGGRYCLASEVEKYVLIPNVSKKKKGGRRGGQSLERQSAPAGDQPVSTGEVTNQGGTGIDDIDNPK